MKFRLPFCLLSTVRRLCILLFSDWSEAICFSIYWHCASTYTLLPLPTTFVLSIDFSFIIPYLPSDDFCVGNTFEDSVYLSAKISIILNLWSWTSLWCSLNWFSMTICSIEGGVISQFYSFPSNFPSGSPYLLKGDPSLTINLPLSPNGWYFYIRIFPWW